MNGEATTDTATTTTASGTISTSALQQEKAAGANPAPGGNSATKEETEQLSIPNQNDNGTTMSTPIASEPALELAPANDNQPADELAATGTE